jgi:hypothetical protein
MRSRIVLLIGGWRAISNKVVMSAGQFHEFVSAVIKEFEDLKDRMRSENKKLSENIKSVTN